ncbi:DMT family transporter [Nocardioides pantholopis]|uniref:DMT family transporter n=1 Tax=Nocardioides pantholopis TaxID=2483798 RepID=UPI000F07EEBA|nr:DMT family transporter [Nocardioides pantholopis]
MSHLAARAGLLQVCLAGVLWGTGGLAVQVVRDAAPIPVLTLSAWRLAIAAVVLLAAVGWLRRGAATRRLLRRHPGRVVLVGLGTAAYQALYFGSVVTAGVTVATVVSLGLAPVLLTIATAVRTRTVPSAGRVAVLATALLGLVLVTGSAHAGETGPHPGWGLLLAAGSGTAYALATALGEPLARAGDPLALTTLTTTVGAAGLLPLGAGAGLASGHLAAADPVVLGTLAYLGVATMALAYGLFYAGLRTTDAGAAVVATLLEPVTAALVAAAVLGERIGTAGLIGTGLILLAVGGLGRRAAGRPSTPVPTRLARRLPTSRIEVTPAGTHGRDGAE